VARGRGTRTIEGSEFRWGGTQGSTARGGEGGVCGGGGSWGGGRDRDVGWEGRVG